MSDPKRGQTGQAGQDAQQKARENPPEQTKNRKPQDKNPRKQDQRDDDL